MSVIPSLIRRVKQVDCHKFNASLGYRLILFFLKIERKERRKERRSEERKGVWEEGKRRGKGRKSGRKGKTGEGRNMGHSAQ